MTTNTTPTPQELAEAVELFDEGLLEGSGHKEDKALLTILRAARAPRLTEAQREDMRGLLKWLDFLGEEAVPAKKGTPLCHVGIGAKSYAQKLRSAFPEVEQGGA